MRELALLANVSVSTVSKAFSDADDVSEDTKKLIFDLAREHGCYGKFYKGKFHKQIMAIICHELGDSLYSGYVERLRRIIEKNGGIAIISVDDFSPSRQAELMEYFASYLRVDGIFVVGMNEPPKRGYEIPIVAIMSSGVMYDSVNVDVHAPITEAVALLRSLGHTNIAFIGEALTRGKAKQFCVAMGLNEDSPAVIESSFRFEKAGEDGVRQLLDRGLDCTAIICAYDGIAMGAIRQLKRSGYAVPNDFSVVGIDNINISEYMETPLTTIDTQPDEVCMIAWDLMSRKQKNRFYRSNQHITITGKLVLRESVAPRNNR